MWYGISYADRWWLMGERRQWSLPLAQGLPAVWIRVGAGAVGAAVAGAGSGATGAGATSAARGRSAVGRAVRVVARVQGVRGWRRRRRRWGWVRQKASQRPERCRARRLARDWAPWVVQRMPACTRRA